MLGINGFGKQELSHPRRVVGRNYTVAQERGALMQRVLPGDRNVVEPFAVRQKRPDHLTNGRVGRGA